MLDCRPSRVGQLRSRQTTWHNHPMGECRYYSMHLLAIDDLLSTKRMAAVTVEDGAINSLYAATSPEALTLGGKVCYSQPSDPMINFVCPSSTWSHIRKSWTPLLRPAMQSLPRKCGTGVRTSLRDTEWSLHSCTRPMMVTYLGAWVL